MNITEAMVAVTPVQYIGVYFDRYVCVCDADIDLARWIEADPRTCPSAEFWRLRCPCGVLVTYDRDVLPRVSTPHPCGNPHHWSVKVE